MDPGAQSNRRVGHPHPLRPRHLSRLSHPPSVYLVPRGPRQLTVKPRVYHEALQTARQRQETPEFRAQYALRAGVESSLSQGVRRFALRQSRYIGLVRTHLQQVLTATAMNVVRVIDWLRGKPLGEKKRPAGTL